MASPFPANATITFSLPTQTGEINEYGNPVTATEDLILRCYLRVSRGRDRTNQTQPDGELTRLQVEGRIVGRLVNGVLEDIAEMPSRVQFGQKGTATIDRPTGNLTAEFYLEPSIPSAFGVEAVLGGAIKGTLLFPSAWGDIL